jgi:uncharacterized membrane protein
MTGTPAGAVDHRPLIAAGTTLGIGMGGFVDGILFHQLLQVHNMLSARHPTTGTNAETIVVNLEINMFWDGLFHTLTWLVTAVGLGLLWSAMNRPSVPHSTPCLLGSMALGWGLFNLVEGIIDHHILQLHHVVEGSSHLGFDIAFLVSGVILSGLGLAMIWFAKRRSYHAMRGLQSQPKVGSQPKSPPG